MLFSSSSINVSKIIRQPFNCFVRVSVKIDLINFENQLHKQATLFVIAISKLV